MGLHPACGQPGKQLLRCPSRERAAAGLAGAKDSLHPLLPQWAPAPPLALKRAVKRSDASCSVGYK